MACGLVKAAAGVMSTAWAGVVVVVVVVVVGVVLLIWQ